MNTIIAVEGDNVLVGVRSFLRQLLEADVVEAIYVHLQNEDGIITPALVTDSSLLEAANPLAPVMPINGARAVSVLTGKEAPARIAAVLRPCEVRALVELVKLQQASLDKLVLISIDCPGTCEVNDYELARQHNGFSLHQYLESGSQGNPGENPAIRQACQMCQYPICDTVPISLHLFGADVSQGIPVVIDDELATAMHLEEVPTDGAVPRRAQVIEQVLAKRGETRVTELARIRQRLASDGGMASLFATCLRCHNCMTACPICYCKTCLFRSEAMDHSPEYYLHAARRKGATRLLSDTLLFHMTRLMHMGTSCVSCGMCTAACPVDIPVGVIFTAISEPMQAAFAYQPGLDINEPLPLVTFQVDEWTEIGEPT